ncbi:MAG: winged helix-turn-helix transcriptional regulator [Oscillospiraceae bacterium]|jgi:DNA-binding MarR family transcriptional regulator|nr:winged helix-turn-helix transcriptional regulator [Oscillospiraceae bacterium]
MKNVVGTFHKIQKAYYQYCYQAVEPDGIKMSEMVCILSLYNSAPKDTARDIIEYSRLSPGMVSRSLESLRKSGFVEGYRDQEDNRLVHLRLLPKAAPILAKLSQAQTKFITGIADGISEEDFARVCQTAEAMADNLESNPKLKSSLT